MPGLATLARIGATRQATLDAAVTLTLTGPDIAVTGGKPLDAAMLAALAAAAAELGAARLSWNGETVAMRAQPVVALGRARVPLPPGAFLQASAEAERVLVGLVREAVGGAARIADLFAGCGTFALPLAEAAEVHAVESDAAMTAALDLGWRGASGLRRVSVETRDLFRRPLLAAELRRHDAVVIDPPRAGAEAQTEQLAAARVPVIVAVSCNPVSLARDARLLVSAGYRLDWVQVVDQFRWSPHIELVARLSLPHIPAATTRGQG
jgi:23S rRNA (uracil1939-C5)-methyltransferase